MWILFIWHIDCMTKKHSYEINKGLRIARQLLLDLNEAGIPTGCEFLDTVSH